MVKIKYTSKLSNTDSVFELPPTYEEYKNMHGSYLWWPDENTKQEYDNWVSIYERLISANGQFEDEYWTYYLLDGNRPCLHDMRQYHGFSVVDMFCTKCGYKKDIDK